MVGGVLNSNWIKGSKDIEVDVALQHGIKSFYFLLHVDLVFMKIIVEVAVGSIRDDPVISFSDGCIIFFCGIGN